MPDIANPLADAKRQARINLNVSRDLNPELEAANFHHSQEFDIPVDIVRNMDNRDLEKPDSLENREPVVLEFLAADVNRAAVARGDVENLNAIALEARRKDYSPAEAEARFRNTIRARGGYDVAQLSVLKARGYRAYPFDPFGRNGLYNSYTGKLEMPVLPEWYEGEIEREKMEAARESLGKAMDRSVDAILKSATPEKAATDYLLYLTRENAVLRQLFIGNPNWQSLGDEDVRGMMDLISRKYGVETSDIDIARLRKSGVADTEWNNLLNFFGAKEISQLLDSPKAEEIANITELSPFPDRLKKIMYLEQQSREMRGRTFLGQTADAITQSIPFMGELAATGGVSGVARLLSWGGLRAYARQYGAKKAAAALAGAALKQGAKSMPFVAPGQIAGAVQDVDADAVAVIGENGKTSVELTRARYDELGTALAQRLIGRYISNVTEYAGVVPANALQRLLPQKLRDGLIGGFVRELSRDKVKFSRFNKLLNEAVPVGGIVEELGEEYLEKTAGYLLTKVSEVTGVKALDMGQPSWWDGAEGEAVRLASVASMVGGMNLLRFPGAVRNARRAWRFADSHRKLTERIRESELAKRSPELATIYTRQALRDETAAITPQAADALFQSSPDFASKLGITPESIAQAGEQGRLLTVSMADADVMAATDSSARQGFETLLQSVQPLPGSTMTVEEAMNLDLGVEAATAVAEEAASKEARKAVLDATVSQLKAAGRSNQEIDAYLKLFAVADYMAAHSSMTADEWISNLSFRAISEADYLRERNRKFADMFQEGDLFRQVKAALPAEQGATALFTKKYRSVSQILPELADTYNSFPERIVAADGAEILMKNPERGKVMNRFLHLIKEESATSGDRDNYQLEKVRWLPRIPETMESAQAKLRDPKTGNYAYVRSYADGNGGIHVVIVSKDGVVIGQEEYDHGLITQFLDKFASRRDYFEVVWEKASRNQSSAQTATAGDSIGDAALSPDVSNNIDASDEKVKPGVIKKYRGAINFGNDYSAVVSLFETADASTLIHETGHYIKRMMEYAVRDELVTDDRIARDLDTINRWLDTQATESKARDEIFAKGFEAYIMEGKAPRVELRSAFAALAKLLTAIYRHVRALGVPLSDEVRRVFDGLLVTEEQALQESAAADIAAVLDPGLLGLSVDEAKVYADLSAQAVEQTTEELHEAKQKYLAKLRPEWRRQAREEMNTMRVYRTWEAIRAEGGLDYSAVVDLYNGDKSIADYLRKKGLTNAKSKSGKQPLVFAAEQGYSSAYELLEELSDAPRPAEYVRQYVAEREARASEAFDAGEIALAAQSNIDRLELMMEALAQRNGRTGYRVSRAMFEERAKAEVDAMPVSRILSDSRILRDIRQNLKDITKACRDKDFNTAFDVSQKARLNLEVLRQKKAAKERIGKVEALIRRGRTAKKGTVDGRYHRALQELAQRFGFTDTEPSVPGGHTVASVLKGLYDTAESDAVWPEWVSTAHLDFHKMEFRDFDTLGNLAAFLYGDGREIVKEQEKKEREGRRSMLEECLVPLSEQKAKYLSGEQGLRHLGNALVAPLGKLWRFCREADNFSNVGRDGKMGPNERLIYLRLRQADSTKLTLQNEMKNRLEPVWKYFSKRMKEWNLTGLPAFNPEVASSMADYQKWTPDKLLGAALHRGSAENLRKMAEGHGWTTEDLNNIYSRLTVEDWKMVQRIWDAWESVLWPGLSTTFREVNHFDLKKVEPTPFEVDGVTFNGGYYKLRNLSAADIRRIQEARTMAKSGVFDYRPEAIYPTVDSTMERGSSIYPVDLRISNFYADADAVEHYIAFRQAAAPIVRMVSDPQYRKMFGTTQSFERYDEMLDLLKNVVNPAHSAKVRGEFWLGAVKNAMTTAYLGANLSSMLMQLPGLLVGVSEVGIGNVLAHWPTVWSEDAKVVRGMSSFMNDRFHSIDRYMKDRIRKLNDGDAMKLRDWLVDKEFYLMRWVDNFVSLPLWDAKYDQMRDRGMSHDEAIAEADSFIARTQGSGRPIDASGVQNSPVLNLFAVFYSAVSAVQEHWTYNTKAALSGGMKAEEALQFALFDVAGMIALSAFIRYALAGGDDENRWNAAMRELITAPLQGVPVARDLADLTAGEIMGDRRFNSSFQAPVLGFMDDIARKANRAIRKANEGEWGDASISLIDLVGDCTQLPAVRILKRLNRTVIENFNGGEEL